MSEAVFSPRWQSGGFMQDGRFAPAAVDTVARAPAIAPEPAGDPVETARREGFDEGYQRGFEDARTEADARIAADREALVRLDLSIRKMDAELADDLREKLRTTVELLCAEAVLPLALDKEGLIARIDRAIAMFQRADDERVLCMHPDDLDLVRDRLPPGLELRCDATMERGAIRVETDHGGVEDGPAQWRRSLAFALGQC